MAAEKVTAPAETEAEVGKERAKMVGLEIKEEMEKMVVGLEIEEEKERAKMVGLEIKAEMEKMMVGLEIEEEIEAKEAKRSHKGGSSMGERTSKSREL